MGEENRRFGDLGLEFLGDRKRNEGWRILEGGGGGGDDDDNVSDGDPELIETSVEDRGSRDTRESSSFSSEEDLVEDASSPPSPAFSKPTLYSSSSSSSSSLAGKHGPLYGLSDLMAQLPIK